MIDLRSDTVTQPTEAMRQAMASAPVGDDVYGEDPTIAALEEETADLLGMESALYVPSGTMANQIALLLHCRPGDAVFCGHGTHMARYESGAAGGIAGVQFFEAGEGIFTADALAEVVFPDAFYYPRSRLLAIENTHNHSGGRVFDAARRKPVIAQARALGLAVHLDGARLWNAAIALDESLPSLTDGADTVSVCYSKGLGAPMGSALGMPKALRKEALRYRRRLGGALRQAGIVAAGALHAIRHHRADLAEDHRRARALAEAVVAGGVRCDIETVETNMVRFEVSDAPALVAQLAGQVGLSAIGPQTIRAVTHRDLDDDAITRAAAAIVAAHTA